jgi:hypothetical protein
LSSPVNFVFAPAHFSGGRIGGDTILLPFGNAAPAIDVLNAGVGSLAGVCGLLVLQGNAGLPAIHQAN